MKKIRALALLLVILSTSLVAQKPNEIHGIAKESKSKEYYQEQSTLWKLETDQNPGDGYAWYQYYKAERAYLQKAYPQLWLDDHDEIFSKLEPIVTQCKTNAGDTFEYYLIESINNKEYTSIEYLIKAYEIDPERTETYEELLVHYVNTFQDEEATKIAKKMIHTNYYSNANLLWNYNSLQTADPNGIFIANGDMDAIPRWVLQYGKGIRKDVLVVSKWLLAYEDDYRKRVFRKINMKDLDKTRDDYEHLSEYVDDLTTHILTNSKRPVYMGCGTNINFFKQAGIEDNMYLVGIAFVYSKKGFDNMAVTEMNFEEKYDLEYIFHNFQYHPEDEIVKTYMNVTYIPGIMKLRRHFEETNNSERVKYYTDLFNRIAEDSGRKEEIMSWY